MLTGKWNDYNTRP